MKFFDPMIGPFGGGREPVDDNQGKNDDESIVSRSGRKRGPKSRFERKHETTAKQEQEQQEQHCCDEKL